MRPPAQAGLHAPHLIWESLDTSVNDWLAPLLSTCPGKVEGALSGFGAGRPVYLRLTRSGVERPEVFIKRVPSFLVEHESRVARLGLSLAGRGVATPTLRGVLPLDDGSSAFLYDWIEGQPPSGSAVEMTRLGQAVAGLHRALQQEARNYDIATRTRSRWAGLLKLARSKRFASYWRGSGEEDFVWQMRDCFLAEHERMQCEASPCHGDLHKGNVLIRESDECVFIDLEDALHTAVWPGFDLVKLVERIVLPTLLPLCTSQAEQAISALIQSYVGAGGLALGMEITPGQGTIARTMRWHMGLAISVLASIKNVNPEIVRCEISKFKQINKLIDQFERVL